MQNPHDVDAFFALKVINPDGLKSSDRPCAKVMHLRIGRAIARPHVGILPQSQNRAPDGLPNANCNLRQIRAQKIIAKLPNDIIGGSLPIRNIHERWLLRSVGMASPSGQVEREIDTANQS